MAVYFEACEAVRRQRVFAGREVRAERRAQVVPAHGLEPPRLSHPANHPKLGTLISTTNWKTTRAADAVAVAARDECLPDGALDALESTCLRKTGQN
ncbi:hypothetical protein A9Z42_0003900 [Trichoderma parareesei]|uniref:Uncharacterized protein n=1 Tax=Trichoderma parareesei TaxID=858221 RepID=A0A2H3A7Z7_TRIPA|nr:hypothetical protein A9Z42_0003900 [Trichoderma parareesei]